jgi:hypothetical protein
MANVPTDLAPPLDPGAQAAPPAPPDVAEQPLPDASRLASML